MENIANFIFIPTAIDKPISEREKRWILQREIFALIEQEDLRLLNWKRYISYLKKYKISERSTTRPMAIKMWKKCNDKEVKRITQLTARSFGYFTSHVNSDDLFTLKSKVQDKLNRSESPTCYIYSLSTVDKVLA